MVDMMLFYDGRNNACLDDDLNSLSSVKTDLVMFNEFRFYINDVISKIKDVSSLAVTTGTDVLLTPHTNYWNAPERLKWGVVKEKCSGSNVSFESGSVTDDYTPESIGFWFGKDGLIYAFPKGWAARPVHKIPGTNTGVIICGEINYVSESDLGGVNFLLNPSREGDDVYLRGRTMLMSGVPFEKVVGDVNDSQYFFGSLDYYIAREKRSIEFWSGNPRDESERKHYLDKMANVEETARGYLERDKRDITKGLLNPSLYLDKISVLLKQNPMPLVRCDNYNCSGILFLPEGMKIEGLNYSSDCCKLGLGKV